MSRLAVLPALALALLLLACGSAERIQAPEWGEPYADVVVPPNYEPYNNPPFRRDDGGDGRRIFGRYSYRSVGEGIDRPERVLDFLNKEMAEQGWRLLAAAPDSRRGTLTARYNKGSDEVVFRLGPNQPVRGTERYSILVVEMNPQFG